MSIEVVEPIWQLVDIDTSISDETHQLSVSWPRIDGAGCIFFSIEIELGYFVLKPTTSLPLNCFHSSLVVFA